MLTQRIVRLNDKVRNTDPTIDLDRARLFTEFYSRPSMDNYILRRAKAFQYFLENRKIFIDEDSQIAGHPGERFQAVPLHPDVTKWLYDDFDTLDNRITDHLHFNSPDGQTRYKTFCNGQTKYKLVDLDVKKTDYDVQGTLRISQSYDKKICFTSDRMA